MRTTTLLFVLVVSSLAHAASFTRQPISQRATGTEVVLKWTQSLGAATVTYGPKGGATQTANDAATLSGAHELKLTGLTPSTRYAFTVDVSGSVASGEFSTAALAGEAFSFVVYGDNRTNDANHQSVVDAIKKEGVDFLIETGDVIELPLDNQYDNYFTIEKDLLLQNVLFPTLGNHEYGLGFGVGLYKENFYTPAETYYSFDWGNSRFVVFDFNAGQSTQTTWADGVMADARSKGIEHIFAIMHHSPYDSGNHGENTMAKSQWVPVFQKYNVDLILAGHDHDYERGLDSGTNLRYLVTGGGGAPLYADNSMKAYQQVFNSTLHYVKISIAGPMVTVTALKPDGSQIDSFSFSTASTTGGTTAGGTTAGGTTAGGTTAGGTTAGGTTAGGTTAGGTTAGGTTAGGTTAGGTTAGGTTAGGTTTSGGSSGGASTSGGCSTTGSGGDVSLLGLLLLSLFLIRRRHAA